MNSVKLFGRIANDLNPKYTESGMCVTRFAVAVNRPKKKDEAKAQADFIDCVAFGKTAETIGNYFSKGNKILIEGRIQTGSYEKEGKKIKTVDVIVNNFEFVESANKKQQTGDFTDFGEEIVPF